MSLEKITARLYADTDSECAEIIRKAEEEAEEIIGNARKEAASLIKAEKEQAEKDGAVLLEKAVSAAAASERRAMLAAKSELIRIVLKSAKEKLNALDDTKYFELLLFLAKKNIRSEKGIMYLSEKDLKRLPSDFEAKLGGLTAVSEKPVKTDGGFILKYGDIEINCTFDALFSAYSDELKAKASEILFG